jgi:hypothetical protein
MSGVSLLHGTLDLELKCFADSSWQFPPPRVTPLQLFENAGLRKTGI